VAEKDLIDAYRSGQMSEEQWQAHVAAGDITAPPEAKGPAEAFSFIYPHLLSGWRQAGAEIVPFSPLADEAPPSHCDACWLPGGYPELHASRLAAANHFKVDLGKFAASRRVHGECGGYMVLGQWLEDAEGNRHAMTGLLSHATSFAERRLHLGYRTAKLSVSSPLGRSGEVVRGHEFHYSSLTEPGGEVSLADLFDAEGNRLGATGGRRGHVTGTFFHVVASAEPHILGDARPRAMVESA